DARERPANAARSGEGRRGGTDPSVLHRHAAGDAHDDAADRGHRLPRGVPGVLGDLRALGRDRWPGWPLQLIGDADPRERDRTVGTARVLLGDLDRAVPADLA